MRPEDTQMASGRVDEPDITIPREALAAGRDKLKRSYFPNETNVRMADAAEDVFLAMLRNWPHKTIGRHTVLSRSPSEGNAIILPLTEKPDD